MSARVSVLSLDNPRASAAYEQALTSNLAALDIPTLCLARAYAGEVLRDASAVERVSHGLRMRICASMQASASAS